MYKIPKELAFYLLDNSKEFDIPSVEEKTDRPFVVRNLNSIGSISPLLVSGMDCKYLVELDAGEFGFSQASEVAGFWLYRNDDVKRLQEPFEIPRGSVDRYTTDMEAVLDISDCVLELPSSIEKLTCLQVNSLDRLLELEPGLKACLEGDPTK